MTNVKNILMIGLMSFFALTATAQASEEDSLSVSSVGRGAKLVLKKDLLVPANSAYVSLLEVARGTSIVASCELEMRDVSLDARVIKAGREIVFSGQVADYDTTIFHFHNIDVESPEAVKWVTCRAQRLDMHGQWQPTPAIIWDLKASFSGTASLVMPDPVEIPN
jgi:hypothetical protein